MPRNFSRATAAETRARTIVMIVAVLVEMWILAGLVRLLS